MDELLGKLGIDWKLLIGQIINFIIFLWVISKFVYTPVLEMLQKRSKTIEESIINAKRQETLRMELEIEKETVMAHARKEAEGVVASAVEKAKQARERVLNGARQEAKEIFETATKDIASSRATMYTELKKDVGGLAIDIAKRVIGESLTPQKQEKIIKKMLHDAEKSALRDM